MARRGLPPAGLPVRSEEDACWHANCRSGRGRPWANRMINIILVGMRCISAAAYIAASHGSLRRGRGKTSCPVECPLYLRNTSISTGLSNTGLPFTMIGGSQLFPGSTCTNDQQDRDRRCRASMVWQVQARRQTRTVWALQSSTLQKNHCTQKEKR